MLSADLRHAATASEERLAELAADVERLKAAPPLGAIADLSFESEEPDAAAASTPATGDEEDEWEAVRLVTRYTFASDVQVKVNGRSAQLLDLSVAGCGVRTTTSLPAGKPVRIHLPGDHAPLLCVGEVVWAREEGSAPRTWRGGVQFTEADESAIEAFIIMRAQV